jgi:chromate transporter
VEVRSWIDGPTFVNGIALGQMTPGLILVTATFVGYMLYGVLGALIATVSIFLPSFSWLVWCQILTSCDGRSPSTKLSTASCVHL